MREPTVQADIFSFGVLMYEVLTGTRLWLAPLAMPGQLRCMPLRQVLWNCLAVPHGTVPVPFIAQSWLYP